MIIEALNRIITRYIERKVNVLKTIDVKNVKSSVVFERSYKKATVNPIPDSLLEYISSLKESEKLRFTEFYTVNKNEEFLVANDIYAKMINVEFESDRISLTFIKFEIFSYTLDLLQLKTWINYIHNNYEIDKSNKFGNDKFYFDEIEVSPRSPLARYESILFTMNKFKTNKRLEHIFGPGIDTIISRVDMFINKPEWYTKKGIPYTIGILLHGPPGTGKTSMIKAIGNQTGRHIVNMKIRPTSTQKQIFNMFFSDKIKVLDGQKIEELVIPLDKRIYVLEDIDCLSSIVFQRSETQESENEKKKKEDAEKEKMRRSKEVDFGRPDEIDKSPEINLSFLLNLLDGVLETPGRILIMTSNCPEKLDKALVRPGRVDINVRLGYCSVDTVQKMFNSFFECDSFVFEDIPIRDITPAIVQSILCNNIYDPKGAYNELLKTMTHIPDSPESMKSREMASFNVSGDNVSGDKKTSDSDSEVSESKSKLKYIINI
jgi:hypothetical protein